MDANVGHFAGHFVGYFELRKYVILCENIGDPLEYISALMVDISKGTRASR